MVTNTTRQKFHTNATRTFLDLVFQNSLYFEKNYQKASYLNIMLMEIVNTKQDFEIFLLFCLTSNRIWLIPFMGRSANCLLEIFEKKDPCKSTFLL
jgi:hypothetical protein